MIPSPDEQKIEQIAQNIAPQCVLLRAWSLPGGISAQMTAFEVRLPSGQTQKMILRWPGGSAYRQNPAKAAAQEYRILETVHRLGVAAPAPLLLETSGEIFPWPCFVMEWIEGEPQYAPADRIDFARQAAEHLARIHNAVSAREDLAFLPAATENCAENPGRTSQTSRDAFRTGQISAALPVTRRNDRVLLHGDFWPGNLLWREGRLVAVVDWEDACLGDPLIDLSISRLDMLWIMGLEAMRVFTAHYQSLVAFDFSNLPYWDLCAVLRLDRLAGENLDAWTAFFHPFGRLDITKQTLQDHLDFFVRQAFDQLPRRV